MFVSSSFVFFRSCLRPVLGILLALWFCPALFAATGSSTGWWVEAVYERELPAALIKERKEAGEKLAQAEKEQAKKESAADKEIPEEAAEEEGVPAEVEPESLTLTVTMAGEIVALDSEFLTFRPAVQPGEVLKLPLNQVASLSHHAPGQAPAAEEPDDLEFRVVLRDGSEVPGQLISLTGEALNIALVGSGANIALPLGEIIRVERNVPIGKGSEVDLPEFSGRHIAVLSTGEIVAGQLLPSRDSDKWLRISSPILTAECPLALVDLLLFPDPGASSGSVEEELAGEVETDSDDNNGRPAASEPQIDRAPEAEAESEPENVAEPVVRHLVTLAPAGMIWARSLEVDGGNLMISALGEKSFAVPLDRVESVSFGHMGMSTTAPVLVWGGYADEDDEYKKTLDALAGHIPSRKLIQNMSKVPDAGFMRQLRRARVLLIPEMENYKRVEIRKEMAKAGKNAPSWKDACQGFLRRGGSIIFLGITGEALGFVNESGLGPLRTGGSGGGWEFTAEGKKIGAKVAGVVTNVNSTHYYRKGEPWQVWGAAKNGDNSAALLGRRLERGWVMVFGADFYETSADVTETLVQMIEFSGRR